MDELIKRKSIRLKEHDYSENGYYFVTICAENRKRLFGEIGNDAMFSPSQIGIEIKECWGHISEINKDVILDAFCVMPNHIHGIIIIENVGVANLATRRDVGVNRSNMKLSKVIQQFKRAVTIKCGRQGLPTLQNKRSVFQSGFYEHIIRNEQELYEIREYIVNNPAKWVDDKYYGVAH